MNIENAQRGTFDDNATGERRKHWRVPLRWPLSIRQGRHDTRVLSVVTENLSSRGFCCVVEEPLAAGETLECILTLPLRRDPPLTQALRCEARVVWVRNLGDGRFCTGCRIDDYSIVR